MDTSKLTTGILRPDIQLLRGSELLLFDPAADAYYKVTPQMVKIISALTENLPLAEFQQKMLDNGMTVSGEELLQTITFLRQNNLLVPAYGEVAAKQQQLKKIRQKNGFLRMCSAYLFFKLPPLRVEKFFDLLRPLLSPLASRPLIILLLIPALAGYILSLRDLGLIHRTFTDTLSWAGLVKYFVTIIVLKIIHEAAHSISALHFNCRIRGIGIGFMLFVPRLYTDTTDSYRLPPRQRLLIDAAGIIAELLIGGIAALLWSNLPPGAAKSTMFYIFAVSTLSTLLVNGNPLIRYDGYYILCDVLKIDNLMSRSAETLRQSWRWYFLRLGTPPQGEHRFLLTIFGIASFIYKIFLYTSICMVIYYRFTKAAAIVMLVMEIYTMLLYPCMREVKSIRELSRRSANKAWIFMFIAMIAAAGALLFMEFSWGITLPGEVTAANRTPVAVVESGYLTHALPRSGKAVDASAPVAVLVSPHLEYSVMRLNSTLAFDRLLYDMQKTDENEFVRKNTTARKLETDSLALQELVRRQKTLTVRAGSSGIFLPAISRDLSAGAFLLRNTVIGEVVSGEPVIYAYADDRDISRIRPGMTGRASVNDSLQLLDVKVTRVEKISANLQQSPLLQNFGGPIPAYQENREFRSAQTLYRIELAFTTPGTFAYGRSVTVKLEDRFRLYQPLSKFILSFFRKEF